MVPSPEFPTARRPRKRPLIAIAAVVIIGAALLSWMLAAPAVKPDAAGHFAVVREPPGIGRPGDEPDAQDGKRIAIRRGFRFLDDQGRVLVGVSVFRGGDTRTVARDSFLGRSDQDGVFEPVLLHERYMVSSPGHELLGVEARIEGETSGGPAPDVEQSGRSKHMAVSQRVADVSAGGPVCARHC